MVTETINAILEAEEKANQMISQATEEAKAMVVSADIECEKIRNIAKEAVKEDRKKTVESATKEGDSQYEKIVILGNKDAEALKKQTDISKAVDFIKEKVLTSYGNR